MIHFYFGNGKGKTSAAVGACIRAAGAGMHCAFMQFLKNGTSSEIRMLQMLGIDTFTCDFQGVRFFRNMTPAEQETVIRTHNEHLRNAIVSDYALIVLDELGDALEKQAADGALVETLLRKADCELIVTGHKQTALISEHADYLTEFRCLAHPLQAGITARKGIEY